MSEQNKLIAEFMEYEHCPRCENPDCYQIGSLSYTTDQMKFETDWGWLMPVVEKIATIENGRFGFTIDPFSIEISDYAKNPDVPVVNIVNDDKYSLMKMYYMAVSDFLTWYKTQTNA